MYVDMYDGFLPRSGQGVQPTQQTTRLTDWFKCNAAGDWTETVYGFGGSGAGAAAVGSFGAVMSGGGGQREAEFLVLWNEHVVVGLEQRDQTICPDQV